MPINKLTPAKIAALLRDGITGLHGDGGNLYLQVTVGKTGAATASWIFRYQKLGRTRDMGLGSFPDVLLSEARVEATAARRILRDGGDPIAARDNLRLQARIEAARTITFEAAASAYLEAHAAKWGSHKQRLQWQSSLAAYALPVLGELPVRAIDTALILKVIEPLWVSKTETANRVRRRIEKILDWAKARGFRGDPNPARWEGHLAELLPARHTVREIVHMPALPYTDVPAFMSALRAEQGIAARALEFVVLTAVRTGSIVGNAKDGRVPMRWQDVDFDAGIWTIPKTKSGVAHRVPLAPPALDLLRAVQVEQLDLELVFPERPGKALHHGAMLKVLARMGHAGLTVHGFRATFKSWAGDQTNFAREVVEAALAHKISDALEKAHRRTDFYDKRARLMEAWGSYCASAPAGAKIIQLRK